MFFSTSKELKENLNQLKERLKQLEYENINLKTELNQIKTDYLKKNELFEIFLIYIKTDIDIIENFILNVEFLKFLYPKLCELEVIIEKEEGHFETKIMEKYSDQYYSTMSHSAPYQICIGTETYKEYIIDKPEQRYFKTNSIVALIINKIKNLPKEKQELYSFIDLNLEFKNKG